jgi:hypothetical protein
MQFTDSDIESSGAYLNGELERLDPKMYQPRAKFTWTRDIKLREDVAITDEVTSFMNEEYAGGFGGTGGTGKAWLRGEGTTPVSISVGSNKTITPMTIWGVEVKFNVIDLMKSQRAGRPLDQRLYNAMVMKQNLDIDTQVYMGDDQVGVSGLLNNPNVTKANIGAFDASTVTAETALNYFNEVLNNVWKATEYTVIPDTILVPPAVYSTIVTKQLPYSQGSVLKYVLENNLAKNQGINLVINPCRWLAQSTFGNGRIVAYVNDKDYVRFPLVQAQRLPTQFRDFSQIAPYYAGLGGIEFVVPESIFYGDLAD